jgi:hypothetical protein
MKVTFEIDETRANGENDIYSVASANRGCVPKFWSTSDTQKRQLTTLSG